MCDNCFYEEIDAFSTEEQWLAVDAILSDRLRKGSYRWVENRERETLYICAKCSDHWLISDPDGTWRGYLRVH